MTSSAASKREPLRRLALVIIGSFLVVIAGDVLSQGTTTGGFRYPMRDAATGRKTADVTGDAVADAPGGAGIRIIGLQLVLYSVDGSTNAIVEAADCIYRMEEEEVVSESDVRIRSGTTRISGRGFKWRARDHVVRITSRARVEIGPGAGLGMFLAPRRN